MNLQLELDIHIFDEENVRMVLKFQGKVSNHVILFLKVNGLITT